MAIKNIIAQGIGFSPGSVKFIPTLGFTPNPIATTSLLVTGLYLWALKSLTPFPAFMDYVNSHSSYNPTFTATSSQTLVDTAGLKAPFSLGYFNNTGTTPLTISDGIGGAQLLVLRPGKNSFLFGGETGPFTLGVNIPSILGPGTLEYCLWR